MTGLNKVFKNYKNEHVLGMLGLAVLLYALYKYSENKNLFRAGLTSLSPAQVNGGSNGSSNQGGAVTGASSAQTYAPFNGPTTNAAATSATSSVAMNKPIANPSDLLPSDSNSSWASLNPVGELKNVGLLNPTQMVGINTQGSSLRNANLQLRSEPANPRTNTNCPWNVSTIEADNMRKPLEIGA